MVALAIAPRSWWRWSAHASGSHDLETALRYNQNTLEQTVLAAIAWCGLAVAVPQAFIPAMTGLFVVGRVTFWLGYLVYPTARAFGMVSTGLPTMAAYVWLVADALADRRGIRPRRLAEAAAAHTPVVPPMMARAPRVRARCPLADGIAHTSATSSFGPGQAKRWMRELVR